MRKTPCAGRWELFDSIDEYDHEAARELCAPCPAIVECAQALDLATAEAGSHGHPEGTWAGRLIIDPKPRYRSPIETQRTNKRREFEDQAFDDAGARRAHAAFVAGDRTEWARMGNRAYDRRRKQRNREEGAA